MIPDELDKLTEPDEMTEQQGTLMRTTKSSKNSESDHGKRLRDLAGAKAAEKPRLAKAPSEKVSPKRGQAHPSASWKLSASYADALTKATRLNRTLELVVQVRPGNADPVITERVPDDALALALAAARLRGTHHATEILKSPEMASAREFGKLIGASHETVNQKRKKGELLALEGTTRGLRYPRWQVTRDNRPLPGLAALSEAMGGQSWSVYRFLVQRHAGLDGRTGIEALEDGRVEDVIQEAQAIRDGAFS